MRAVVPIVVGLLALAGGQTCRAQGAADAFNAEVQLTWDAIRPGLVERARREATAALLGARGGSSSARVRVRRVRRFSAALGTAPGLVVARPDALALRVPRAGAWSLGVRVLVGVEVSLGFGRARFDVPVELRIRDVSASQSVAIDWSDPTRPTVAAVARPKVRFDLEVRSSNLLLKLLLPLLNPIAQRLAEKALSDAVSALAPTLAAGQGLPGPVPGAGTPRLADSGAATPFEPIAQRVEAKIARDHLPHGTLLAAELDAPSHGTWEADYGPGGVGAAGQVLGWQGGGDAAIWTGQYLGAEALRHAATADPAAAATAQRLVEGLGNLLEINGGTGLLARFAAPASSPAAGYIRRKGLVAAQAVIGGQTWLGYQGDAGISRDQYSGVFFGLGLAFDHVPAVRADCARRIVQMLDYLVARRWVVSEDRPPFDGTVGFPTTWVGVAYQQLAFLLLGERVAPGRYAAELQRLLPNLPLTWLGFWTNTFNLDGYYKFNLAYLGLHTYLRLEQDPARWRDMARGYWIMERYVGHHHNPHLDLIGTSIDPGQRSAVFPGVREALRRFLQRNHRVVAPATVDLSGVTWVATQSTHVAAPGKGTSGTVSQRMPSAPLDIPLRGYTRLFQWRVNPFEPAVAGAGDPKLEKPGLDLLLPYWMGRHQGAF